MCFVCDLLCGRVCVSCVVCLCLCACILLSVFASFVIECFNVMLYGLFVSAVLDVCVVRCWCVM